MVKRKLNYPNGMIVDLSNIRISNNKYEWDKSVGAKIPFVYNGVEDYFILEDYKKSKITISYKDLTKTISCSHFLREERCGSVTDLFHRIALLKPYLIDYVEDRKLFFSLSSASKKKIWFKCPYCGYREYISARTLFKRVNICPICSDGISYPEKFISNMLLQLNIKFEKHKTFDWSFGREYDFYFKYNDEEFIIEANGSQHYRAEFERLGGRSFEEEYKNDVYKEKLAKNNNINYYIKFECSESNKIHMINAIYNSIFHVYFENEGIFNNINFEQCDYFATNNSTFRDICNMWNSSKTITTTDIANNLNLDIRTVIKYLTKGNEFNMCKYTTEIGKKRGRIKYEKIRYGNQLENNVG